MQFWEEIASAEGPEGPGSYPEMADFVERVSFSADDSQVSHPVRVLPDGCTDLLLSVEEGSGRASLRVFGIKTTALVVRSDVPVSQIAVHLRPGAAQWVLGLSAAELRDRSASLDELWGAEGDRLLDRVMAATSWAQRRRELIRSVQAEACHRENSRSPAVEAAVAEMHRRRGRVRIAELAETLGTGTRSLERRFREHVGVSPKAFARTLRFQSARRALASGQAASEVAVAAGYADQPHMVREFRAFSGTTPSAP